MKRKQLSSLLFGLFLTTSLSAQTISIAITSDDFDNTICSGTTVTYTATPTGTISPTYRWKKNGVVISGATSPTYTTSSLVNNDVISADLAVDFSNIVTSNLVLHLDAGQWSSYPGSGSIWTDLSGNNNNASLPSALVSTYSSSIGGGSFQFQHNSNYPIQSSAMTNWNLTSTNALSVETWVKQSYSSDHQFWFSTPDLYYRLGIAPSGSLFWDMAHYVDQTAGNIVSAGVWHHVVYTAGIESGNITTRIYIDGVFATSKNEGVSALSSFTNYLIGSGQNTNQHQLNANMGLIRVYNKTLSATEVTQNYDAQQARFTGSYAGAVSSNTITTTVTADNSITLASAAGTNAQSPCINTPITDIRYSTTGATGATFGGLPSGVSGAWSGNMVTISGTPSVAGTYSYTVTLTGGCSASGNQSGTIVVNEPSFSPAAHTIAELQPVTTASATITWYSTSSGGTPLAVNTVLSDGSHYYASQTVNGTESMARLDVTAILAVTPCTPTANTPQTLASGSTVANLTTLTGESIRWYTTVSGGTALSATTVLTSGTYYASQTVSCTESANRVAVTVVVNP